MSEQIDKLKARAYDLALIIETAVREQQMVRAQIAKLQAQPVPKGGDEDVKKGTKRGKKGGGCG